MRSSMRVPSLLHVKYTSTWMKQASSGSSTWMNQIISVPPKIGHQCKTRQNIDGAPHSFKGSTSRESREVRGIPFIGINSGLSMSASRTIRSDTSKSIHQNWCGDMEFLQYHYPLRIQTQEREHIWTTIDWWFTSSWSFHVWKEHESTRRTTMKADPSPPPILPASLRVDASASSAS